ncbi:MAG: tRNA lysidine(34) synthetase TilS, partial [Chloroflexi bacterium]|nr:tRNA lysidine(34) synthetase TilS [Chloroflexota bacterium]
GFAPSAPLGTSQDKSVKLGINVIRPILLLTREETAAYCRQHDLNPRTDTSNLSLSPFRNRIRLRLLPLLKEYNPEIVEALVRTARIAQDDMAFLESDAAKAWEKVARKEQNNIVFEKKKFLALPLALQRELLLKGIETLVGTLKDIELVHIEEVIDAMRKPAGRVIILPDSLEFVIEYERFVLGKDPAALSPFPQLRGEFKLNVPGTTKLPGWVVTVTVVPPDVLKRDVADYKAYLDFEKTGKDLTVRSRQPGDRFHPMGMTEPKKLNQFMVDSKIPHLWRERIPVVCSPEQIVWVVGYRIDERVKVMPETKQLLELKFRRV